jgi:hypothetical protein
MTTFQFGRATKARSRARLALIGPSGSGKTFSALSIATSLGGRIAVIDTEHGSASKYADQFDFDVLELGTFGPLTYVEAMKAAAEYDILIIDSLSHAWMGKDGALEQVDRAAKRSPSGNSFAAWRDVTPQHNALVEALVAHPAHLIVTMRSKTEYVLDTEERGGRKVTVPRKVGTAPVQRDGLEYEFDVVADMTLDHDMVVTKTRAPALDGKVFHNPGEDVANLLWAWLSAGEERAATATPSAASTAPSAATPQPARSASATGSGEPAGWPETDGPGPAEDPQGDVLGSWRAEIEAQAQKPRDLVMLLPRIDDEGDPFRRSAALRFWTQTLCENGREQDVIVAGRAIARWPESRPGRAETRAALVTALRELRAREVPVGAGGSW